MSKGNPTNHKRTIEEQEVARLERMLANRRARAADAQRKLTAARERMKAKVSA